MKTKIQTIAGSIALATTLSANAQFTPNSIKYAKMSFGAGDRDIAPVGEVIKVNTPQTANALYKIEGQKVTIYFIGQYPKRADFNISDFVEKCDSERGTTKTNIQEDRILPEGQMELETANGLGKVKIDLWNHSRKEVTVDGIQTTIIIANKVIVGPFANNFRFDFPGIKGTNPIKSAYKWQTRTDNRAYLVEQSLNATPTASLEKIWTEGASSIVKVGMIPPPSTPIIIGGVQVDVSGYQNLGFINLAATVPLRPQLESLYYIKCKFVGIPETFVYKVIFLGADGDDKQPDASKIGLDPKP